MADTPEHDPLVDAMIDVPQDRDRDRDQVGATTLAMPEQVPMDDAAGGPDMAEARLNLDADLSRADDHDH